MDFYQVSKDLGWTWADWLATPPPVRELILLYMQSQAEERADRDK
jgi:hypothetical protein